MADYADASSNADDALVDAAEGLIEEYEISPRGRRVKKGRLLDQVKAATILEGLAARRGGSRLFKLGKPRSPR